MVKKTLALGLLCLWLLAPAVSADVSAPMGLTPRVRSLWLSLDRTTNKCPADFDYFPAGGIRIFYCHVLSLITEAEFDKLAPKIFLSGPHTTKLNLTSRKSFGHYNPQFVRWLGKNLIPGAQDARFVKTTQPIFNKYILALARSYYVTHVKLSENPEFMKQEKERLLAQMGAGRAESYDKYYGFMSGSFLAHPETLDDGGYNGNVVKTAVAFWIRRSIDGTDSDFFETLQTLLRAYDPLFLPSGQSDE